MGSKTQWIKKAESIDPKIFGLRIKYPLALRKAMISKERCIKETSPDAVHASKSIWNTKYGKNLASYMYILCFTHMLQMKKLKFSMNSLVSTFQNVVTFGVHFSRRVFWYGIIVVIAITHFVYPSLIVRHQASLSDKFPWSLEQPCGIFCTDGPITMG